MPKYAKITRHSFNACANVFNDLKSSNILEKMNIISNSNPNINLNIVGDILENLKEKHFPCKRVKFNKHKHKILNG